MDKNEAVVLIHGIWMKGPELFYLRFKLWRKGYRLYQFHYPSLFKTPEQNAESLNKFVGKINEATVHFVAHSLGGIVVTHFLNNHACNKTGKVVLIGTPINGSALARYLQKNVFLKYLLGKSVIKGLVSDTPKWLSERRLCVIAGTKKLGIGMLLARKVMQQQNDGTVNLDETQIKKANEFYVVPHSHFSMLWSLDVAKKIKSFLAQ